MSLGRINQKTDELLRQRGIENSEARQLIGLHSALFLVGLVLYAGFGNLAHLAAYALGGCLSIGNFYLLAKIIPQVIGGQKGGTFVLLLGFYLRLLGTGFILFLAVAWLRMPIVSLLLGLSTVFLNILLWLGKFVLTHKHKEA